MFRASLKIATVFLCALLAACGGGDGDSPASASNLNDSSAPTAPGSAGQGTPPPNSSLAATVTTAPAEDASLQGIVRLEVRGTAIENAELLPPGGYGPRLGVFTVSADKTTAWVDFDTRSLPNGTLLVRISAFDRPPGSSGASEVIAMATRRWQLRNDPAPVPAQIPAASYMPEVHIPYLDLPYVDPQPLTTMMQMDDISYETMLANDWPRVEAVMHRYVPPNVILFPPTPLGFYAAWDTCMRAHTRLVCREAMPYMIGLMQSKQG
jgi:hypothetical protein